MAGIVTVLTWTPPPAVGGYVQNIDLFLNLFSLDRYQVDYRLVTDLLSRTLGVYERNKTTALWRSINPLTYIGFAVEWLASLPFRLLGRAGFDGARAEQSLFGRIVKLVIEIVVVLGSAATILEFIGWTDRVRAILAPYLD
jgi:hypothetical protein